jgi:hypothetical protein
VADLGWQEQPTIAASHCPGNGSVRERRQGWQRGLLGRQLGEHAKNGGGKWNEWFHGS